MPDTLQS